VDYQYWHQVKGKREKKSTVAIGRSVRVKVEEK